LNALARDDLTTPKGFDIAFRPAHENGSIRHLELIFAGIAPPQSRKVTCVLHCETDSAVRMGQKEPHSLAVRRRYRRGLRKCVRRSGGVAKARTPKIECVAPLRQNAQ
jgi:hypothetical protein